MQISLGTANNQATFLHFKGCVKYLACVAHFRWQGAGISLGSPLQAQPHPMQNRWAVLKGGLRVLGRPSCLKPSHIFPLLSEVLTCHRRPAIPSVKALEGLDNMLLSWKASLFLSGSTVCTLEAASSRGAQGLCRAGTRDCGQLFMKVRKRAGTNHGCSPSRAGQKGCSQGHLRTLVTWKECPQCGRVGMGAGRGAQVTTLGAARYSKRFFLLLLEYSCFTILC